MGVVLGVSMGVVQGGNMVLAQGGGSISLVPRPNVRNDDYCLQYNITYRGSGNEVVGNCSWNVVGMLRINYITFMSS